MIYSATVKTTSTFPGGRPLPRARLPDRPRAPRMAPPRHARLIRVKQSTHMDELAGKTTRHQPRLILCFFLFFSFFLVVPAFRSEPIRESDFKTTKPLVLCGGEDREAESFPGLQLQASSVARLRTAPGKRDASECRLNLGSPALV